MKIVSSTINFENWILFSPNSGLGSNLILCPKIFNRKSLPALSLQNETAYTSNADFH